MTGFGGKLKTTRGVGRQRLDRPEDGTDRLTTQRLLADPQGVRRVGRAHNHDTFERHAELGQSGRVQIMMQIEIEDPAVGGTGVAGSVPGERICWGPRLRSDELVNGGVEKAAGEGRIQCSHAARTAGRRPIATGKSSPNLVGELDESRIARR